jgi:hypothetical protein
MSIPSRFDLNDLIYHCDNPSIAGRITGIRFDGKEIEYQVNHEDYIPALCARRVEEEA